MNARLASLAVCVAALGVYASAQTVTGSGSTNTVPAFTGSSTIGNSNITQTSSGVVQYSAGISTTSNQAPAVTNVELNDPMQALPLYSWNVVNASYTNPSVTGNPIYAGYTSAPWITSTDANLRVVEGAYLQPVFVASGTSTGNYLYGLDIYTNLDSPSDTAGFQSVYGVSLIAGVGPAVPATTSIANVIGDRSSVWVQSGALSTAAYSYYATPSFGSTSGPANLVIPNYYGLDLEVPTLANGATITNNWGVWQHDALAKNYFAGKVGIGTLTPSATLEVNGNVKLTANSGASVTFQDGTTQSTAWTGVLCGGDYAEDMRASGGKTKYEPGDVLILADGDSSDVQKSGEPYSTMVAGIYASKPGVIGRRAAVAQSMNNIPMAMVGVVPTKVTAENGPIHRGDLLVTSSAPGYAMKGTDRSRMLGAVIGKAMGPLEHGTGVIEVLVTLQ